MDGVHAWKNLSLAPWEVSVGMREESGFETEAVGEAEIAFDPDMNQVDQGKNLNLGKSASG